MAACGLAVSLDLPSKSLPPAELPSRVDQSILPSSTSDYISRCKSTSRMYSKAANRSSGKFLSALLARTTLSLRRQRLQWEVQRSSKRLTTRRSSSMHIRWWRSQERQEIQVTQFSLAFTMRMAKARCVVQFAEYVQANIQLYSMRNDTDLGPSAVASFVRGELARSLRSKKPYNVNLLLGGMDPITKEPHLYWLDYLASLAPLPYAAHGYAQYVNFPLLNTPSGHRPRSWT